jgi:hypothetical protein
MEDPSEPAVVQELLDERDGRDPPVVVPDRVRDPRRFDGVDHRLRLGRGPAERLLAHHHLAGPGSGDGYLVMRVVGAGDVDDVDVLAGDERAPVRLVRLVAPVRGERLHAFLVARGDRLEDRLVGKIEKSWSLKEGVGVGPAHEAVADQADVQRFHQ